MKVKLVTCRRCKQRFTSFHAGDTHCLACLRMLEAEELARRKKREAR